MALEMSSLLGAARSVLLWAPGLLVRWRFPATRLAELLYIDVQPRNESVRLDLGEAANVRLVIQIINLSPFNLEVDRAQIRFVYGASSVTFNHLTRTKIAPASIVSLYLQEALPDSQASHIRRNWRGNQPRIEGTVEVNSDVRPFTKTLASLTGLHVSFNNLDARKAAE